MCHSNSRTLLTCVINGWRGVSAQYGRLPTCFFQESIHKQVLGKVKGISTTFHSSALTIKVQHM